MTSYVQKKSRVFKEAGEPQPLLPKRSEGRLKRYPSATDARAWTLENEDRRQHILEFLQQKGGVSNTNTYYINFYKKKLNYMNVINSD